MENKNFGDQIRDIVQDSLNNMDFQDLNKKIGDTVNGTIAEVRKSLNLDNSSTTDAVVRPNRGTVTDSSGTVYSSYREVNEREKAMRRGANAYGGTAAQADRSAYNNSASVTPGGQAAAYREAARQVPPAFTNTMNTKEEIRVVSNSQNSQNMGNQANQGAQTQRWRRYMPSFPYSTRPYGSVSGVLYIIFGFLVFGPLALAAVIWAMAVLVGGSWHDIENFLRVFLFVFCPLLLVSGGMAVRGILQRKRVSRFRNYVRELKGKTFIAIKELAYRTNLSERFLVKDLQKMIKHRMFPEGHLDQKKTCLMLTHDSFEQYLAAQNSLDERQKLAAIRAQEERQAKREEEKRQKEAVRDVMSAKDLPEELRAVIAEGREYIRQMREANDAIPGEDISRKLTRLEVIIDKIFTHVEKHPEQTDELHKFMDYYLPTTLKLVNTYREFDAQPVQGENIRKAKLEIEATLDTINSAFEKLFDSMFEDAAMDISTDITVLETMLAQEGLTGEHFSDGV